MKRCIECGDIITKRVDEFCRRLCKTRYVRKRIARSDKRGPR
jgi:hypothetical protein